MIGLKTGDVGWRLKHGAQTAPRCYDASCGDGRVRYNCSMKKDHTELERVLKAHP